MEKWKNNGLTEVCLKWLLTEEKPGEKLERNHTLARHVEQFHRVNHLILRNLKHQITELCYIY